MINFYSNRKVYTNELTPLIVGVEFDDVNLSNDKVVWDFGDGTLVKGLTASHIYRNEGIYEVSMARLSSSGDALNSETYTVSAYNLIPNNIRWAEYGYNVDVLPTGNISDKPFVLEIFNSYQYFNNTIELDLYSHNSNSYPIEENDRNFYLKNEWKFYDLNFNRTNNIQTTPQKIYAKLDENDEIILSSQNDDDSVFVGLSAIAGFYYYDDTPTGLSDDLEPVTLSVTQNLSSFYSNFLDESFVNNNSIYKPLYLYQRDPYKLKVSQDGFHDFTQIKYENTKIPFTISIVDRNDKSIKTQPLYSTGNAQLTAFFDSNQIELSSNPFESLKLKKFIPNESTGAGYYQGYFIPINENINTKLKANLNLNYIKPKNLVINGWTTNEKNGVFYKIKNIKPLFTSIYNEELEEIVTEIEFPERIISGVFGISVDKNYNAWMADAYNSNIYVYDTQVNLINKIDLNSYSSLISSHSSPAQISMNNDYAFVTLFDAGSSIKIDLDTFSIVDSIPFSQNLYNSESGELEIQPTAIEITNKDILWISYTKNYESDILIVNANDYSDRITIENHPNQILEILSDRSGENVYLLGSETNGFKLYHANNNTSSNTLNELLNLDFPHMPQFGKAEYMTLDDEQNIWIACGSNMVIKYEHQLSSMETFFVGSSAYEQSYIGGISSDHLNRIWVLHKKDRKLYLLNSNDTPDGILDIDLDPSNSLDLSSFMNINSYGDWNGFQYYNKFANGETGKTLSLSGESTPFTIFSKNGKYSISKINEDFDMEETLKSYRTTNRLYNYNTFFEEFLGSIVGDFDEPPDTNFGKRIYEKISNFVINHSDPSTANIDQLKSLGYMVGVDIDEFDFIYPSSLKRLIDLLSIKLYKLFGSEYNNEIFSTMAGNKIDVNTYVVSASPQIPFIAREKFNNYYSIIEPLYIDDSETETYALSSYDPSWGWGLSLGRGNNYIGDMYEFYEYISPESINDSSVLNYDDPFTSTEMQNVSSFYDMFEKNKIVDHLISHNLFKGLNLILE